MSVAALILRDRWMWAWLAMAIVTLGATPDLHFGLNGIGAGAVELVAAALLVLRDWRIGTRGVCVTGRYVRTRVQRFGQEAYWVAIYEYEHGGRRFTAEKNFYFLFPRWRSVTLPSTVDIVIDPDHPRLARILWRTRR